MDRVKWNVEKRLGTGKGVARKLRAAGKLPGNVYGRNLEPISLAIDFTLVRDLISEGNWNQALIDLDGEGLEALNGKVFMIKEMQRHHVSRQPLTVDLQMIRLDKMIEIEVPLAISGGEEVKKTGAVLDVMQRTLMLKCLPTNIPTQIAVDASHLQIGQTLHLSDITLPEGVETDLPANYPICSAALTRATVEEEVPAGEGEVKGEAVADGAAKEESSEE